MKVVCVAFLAWFLVWHGCHTDGRAVEATTGQLAQDADSTVTVDFAKDIQPILEKRCSPCHFTGGKMYQRLPFDKGETILAHSEGVLRRIKEDPDAQRIKDYIKQNVKD